MQAPDLVQYWVILSSRDLSSSSKVLALIHSEIRKFLNKNYPNYCRCGFLALPVGEIVGAHIDEGTYYLNKDRYHLSIQGQYKYIVGNEDVVVDAGTLLWFNNKMPHGTVNLGNETRITFVFDVPHG